MRWLIRRWRWWRYRSRTAHWIAWHLPPGVVYHALIRAWAHATTGPYGHEEAPGVLATDVVERWTKDKGVKE
jgi:hypothetical protein